MKKTIAILSIALSLSGNGHSYELATHGRLTEQAYTRSGLGADPSLLRQLGLFDSSDPFGSTYVDMSGTNARSRSASAFEESNKRMSNGAADALRIKGWLMRGAIREDDGGPVFGFITRTYVAGEPLDDPDGNILRYCNHFFDPLHITAFTKYCFGQTLAMSPNWAIGTTNAFALPIAPANAYRNHFSVFSAREALFRALTLQSRNSDGSLRDLFIGQLLASDASPADREKTRKSYWATTFRSLGDVVHLIQDMAQPQHTRDEGHGTGHAAIYELYIDARALGASKFDIDAMTLQSSRGELPSLDYYGRDAAGSPYPIPRFNGYADYWSTSPGGASVVSGQGMADYSSRGFLTPGTSIGLSGSEASRFPKPSRSVYAYGTPVTESTLCGAAVPYRSQYLVGNVPDTVVQSRSEAIRLQSRSIFHDSALAITQNPAFTINHCVMDEHARLLLPRAVAYSAGLIDYFFRGQMEISLPAQGVYGIVDHWAEGAKDYNGFRKIKAKVKNTTPGITPPGATAASAQDMDATAGILVAVAKFHRNTCYQPDLSGEYGALNTDGSFKNPWQTCRSPVEDIVVSNPVTVSSTMNSSPVEYSFNFPTPIPINATDLFLQVVYRGPLGQESDAVVVATKDISEPTFIHNYSRWDQYTYGNYPAITFGGPNPWSAWCLQGYPTIAACQSGMGLTDAAQFSPTTAPIAGYDPANPPVLQNTWRLLVDEPPFSPVVTSVAPVGSLTRVAVLTDAVPTNIGLAVLEWLNTAPNTSKQFQWHTGPVLAYTNQLDPVTNTLVPSITYLPARGFYFPAAENMLLKSVSPGVTPPDFVLVPSQINF